MSIHLVVNTAFFVGLFLVIRPGFRIIKKFVYNYRTNINDYINKVTYTNNNSQDILKKAILQNYNIDTTLDIIKNHTTQQSNTIIKNGLNDIEQIFYKQLLLVEEKVTYDIQSAQQELVNEAAQIAAEIIIHLAKDNEFQHMRNSTITFNL